MPVLERSSQEVRGRSGVFRLSLKPALPWTWRADNCTCSLVCSPTSLTPNPGALYAVAEEGEVGEGEGHAGIVAQQVNLRHAC